MRYNGLNNMFFLFARLTITTLSQVHHIQRKQNHIITANIIKNTLIDNKALSLFKMDDHEKSDRFDSENEKNL